MPPTTSAMNPNISARDNFIGDMIPHSGRSTAKGLYFTQCQMSISKKHKTPNLIVDFCEQERLQRQK